jgi:hypothetical protein
MSIAIIRYSKGRLILSVRVTSVTRPQGCWLGLELGSNMAAKAGGQPSTEAVVSPIWVSP